MRRSIKKKMACFFRITRKRSGFTLIELLFAMMLLAILVVIAISVYKNYLDKAKIAIAESTLDITRDDLQIYNMDNGKYPDSIDFTNCVDENSRAVFSPTFCDQLKKDLSSIEYNTANITTYTLKAHAKDTKNTLITLTPKSITK